MRMCLQLESSRKFQSSFPVSEIKHSARRNHSPVAAGVWAFAMFFPQPESFFLSSLLSGSANRLAFSRVIEFVARFFSTPKLQIISPWTLILFAWQFFLWRFMFSSINSVYWLGNSILNKNTMAAQKTSGTTIYRTSFPKTTPLSFSHTENRIENGKEKGKVQIFEFCGGESSSMLLHLLGLLAGQYEALVCACETGKYELVFENTCSARAHNLKGVARLSRDSSSETIGGKIRGKCLETPDTCPASRTTLVFFQFPHKYRTTRNGWLIWENENALYSTDTQHNTSKRVCTKKNKKNQNPIVLPGAESSR